MPVIAGGVVVAILIALNEFRKKWYRCQLHNDHENGEAAYRGYKALAEHYAELTGDTTYCAHNTAAEQRDEWVKRHEEGVREWNRKAKRG